MSASAFLADTLVVRSRSDVLPEDQQRQSPGTGTGPQGCRAALRCRDPRARTSALQEEQRYLRFVMEADDRGSQTYPKTPAAGSTNRRSDADQFPSTLRRRRAQHTVEQPKNWSGGSRLHWHSADDLLGAGRDCLEEPRGRGKDPDEHDLRSATSPTARPWTHPQHLPVSPAFAGSSWACRAADLCRRAMSARPLLPRVTRAGAGGSAAAGAPWADGGVCLRP